MCILMQERHREGLIRIEDSQLVRWVPHGQGGTHVSLPHTRAKGDCIEVGMCDGQIPGPTD